MPDYLSRTIDTELDTLLCSIAAIALDGPKGVGKTGTAQRRATHQWFLDDPAQRELFSADPTAILKSQAGTILLDEWQRYPPSWDVVRRAVDAGAPPGRFLLTGSATPSADTDTHSGAGRIISLRMRPMGLHERGLTTPTVGIQALLQGTAQPAGETTFTVVDYAEQIVASGFPGLNRLPAYARTLQLAGYLQRIIDRDLVGPEIPLRRPAMLQRWLLAYAAATATTATYATIAQAAAGEGNPPARSTTAAYREYLTQIWLLDPVPGWLTTQNAFTRLQQAPKHHLADPALAARLLNLSAQSLISPAGAPYAGKLFESLATLTVRILAQAALGTVYHLRDHRGDHEIDLLVEGAEGQLVGFEVKLAATVTDADVRHLVWLRQQAPSAVADLVVLNTGTHAYRRPDGVAVIPLALLGTTT